MKHSRRIRLRRLVGGVAPVVLAVVMSLAGCEEAREEKVLDLNAPGVDIEVNKTEDPDGGGSIEIETHPHDQP